MFTTKPHRVSSCWKWVPFGCPLFLQHTCTQAWCSELVLPLAVIVLPQYTRDQLPDCHTHQCCLYNHRIPSNLSEWNLPKCWQVHWPWMREIIHVAPTRWLPSALLWVTQPCVVPQCQGECGSIRVFFGCLKKFWELPNYMRHQIVHQSKSWVHQ